MEHYFDQFQFLEQFDVKAQNKPQRKKKWLLSREYLQPLTEPEDDDSCLEKQAETANGYKKKLLCAYEAAKYGMKEGVLTGVFLGGCWGILKYLGVNFQIGFSEPDIIGDNQKELKNKPNECSPKATEKSSKIPVAVTQSHNVLDGSGNIYHESTVKHIKNMSVMCSKLPEKNLYNATTNHLVCKLNKSKLPVRKDKHLPPLSADGAGFFETNQYFRRKREKVEIVGYAFIHTTSSINGTGSNGSNSPKNTESTSDKNENSPKKNSSDRSNAVAKSSSKVRDLQKMPQKSEKDIKTSQLRKGTLSPAESSVNSLKSADKSTNETQVYDIEGSIYSQLSVEEIELTKTNFSEQIEECESSLECEALIQQQSHTSAFTEETMSNVGDPITDEEETSLKSPLGSRKYSKQTKNKALDSNKASRFSSKADSNRSSTDRDSSRKYSRKLSRKEDLETNEMTQKMSESENLYPNFKKLGSIFVDIDDISNGFTSPPSFSQSRKVSMFDPTEERRSVFRKERQMHDIHNTERAETGPRSLKFMDPDEYNEYTVETSPTCNRSSMSTNKKKEGSFTYEKNCDNDFEYAVESSPAFKESHANMMRDRNQKECRSDTVNPGEAQAVSSKIPLYSRYYGIETLTPGGSPYNTQRKVTRFNETPTEVGSSLNYKKHVRCDSSSSKNFFNEKSCIGEKNLPEDGDFPHEEKHVTQTPENKKYSCDKSVTSETYAISGDNPPYDISHSTETENNKKNLESSLHRKSVATDKYARHCSMESGCMSNRRHVSELQMERSLSSDHPTYDRSKVRIMGSATESKQTLGKAEDVRRGRVQGSGVPGAVYMQQSSTRQLTLVEPDISTERPSHSYMRTERDMRPGLRTSSILKKVTLVTAAPPPKRIQSEEVSLDMVRDQDEPVKKDKPLGGFDFLSSVNENIIIVSACNCAIVLGVVCSIISLTRASLAAW